MRSSSQPNTSPPTHGFFYAVWLYNSPTSHEPLSKAPAGGREQAPGGRRAAAEQRGRLHTMLLTRETSTRPTHPGHVVLRGPFTLGS